MTTPTEDVDAKIKQFENSAKELLAKMPDLDQSDLDMMVYDAFGEQTSEAVNSENADLEVSHDEGDRLASYVNNQGQAAQISVLLSMGWTEDGLLEELAPDTETPEP